MSNTITAFFKGRVGVAEAVYQNDYGLVMNLDSIDLPAHFDCYFSTLGEDEAIPGIGADNQVAIPNGCLSRSGTVTLHIPIHTGSNDSEVEYVVYFKVIGRARPVDDGTPAQMTAIEQALALLQNPIGNIEQIVNEALSFTGDTFAEMQEQLDANQAAFQSDMGDRADAFETEIRSDISDVESDFSNLNAQFQTAVSAVTTDTEVTNIRVGDDNITYATAGEAVRKQFSSVKGDIRVASLINAKETLQTSEEKTNFYFYNGKLGGLGNDYSVYFYEIKRGGIYKVRASRKTRYAFVEQPVNGQTLHDITEINNGFVYLVNSDDYRFLAINGNSPDIPVDPNPEVYEVGSLYDTVDTNIELLNEAVYDFEDITPSIEARTISNDKLISLSGGWKHAYFPIRPNNIYVFEMSKDASCFFLKSKSVGSTVYEYTRFKAGTHIIQGYDSEYKYFGATVWTDYFIGDNEVSMKLCSNKVATCEIDLSDDLALVPNTIVNAKSDNSDFGQLYDADGFSASDYTDISDYKSIRISVANLTSTTAVAGIVFYDENKTPITGYRYLGVSEAANVIEEYEVLSNYKYVRTTVSNDWENRGQPKFYATVYRDKYLEKTSLIEAMRSSNSRRVKMRVAASNASMYEKMLADFICDGANDEVEIQAALDAIPSGGEVWLSSGTFNIDSFDTVNGKRIALSLSNEQYSNFNKTIRGVARSGSTPTIINVTDGALADLGNDIGYLFSTPYFYYGRTANYYDFRVFFSDNQHKYTAIDNTVIAAGKISNVVLSAVPSSISNSNNTPMPVENCVGITGYCGDDNGSLNIMETCFVTGFYEGYRLGGEHLVCTQLNARYNYYSYTFGNYDWYIGTQSHPITLINCCDEHAGCLPKFVRNGNYDQQSQKAMQQVDLIGFNLELGVPQYFAEARGDWYLTPAEEVTPNSFCGRVEFTGYGGANIPGYPNPSPGTTNNPNIKFWADGSGENFITKNMVHPLKGSSSDRNFIPTFMQQYFDTTLNKMLVYNGSVWVDMMGNAV